MKKLITILALLLCTCSFSNQLVAQKIGHLNVDSLMKIWPDYQKGMDSLADAQIKFQEQVKMLFSQIEKQQDLIDSTKLSVSPLVAQLQQTQLKQLQDNYLKFAELAQLAIEELQARISDTLYKKLYAAIANVAKANGYTYILDSSKGGQVMFASPSVDVFDLVRKELKIPLPVKKANPDPSRPQVGGR